MMFLIDKLYRSLEQASSILVYGAGIYANEIYPTLKKMGLKKKINSFVVTEKTHGQNNIDGITINSIFDIEVDNPEYATVLVAVSEKYHQEITSTLASLGFENVALLTDYIINEDDLKCLPDELFYQCIQENSIWDEVNSIKEFHQKIRKTNRQNKDNNLIVYITGNLNARSVKIIGALRRKGLEVIVLGCKISGISKLFEDELLSYNVNYIKSTKIEEVFFLAASYNPLVYFCEPTWGNCRWIEAMIQKKGVFGKIILAIYDVLNDAYTGMRSWQYESEKFCLENADGIVWRYFSKEYLEREKGFIYKGKSIQFLDYCKGYDLPEKMDSNNRLKICFVCGALDYFIREPVQTGYARRAMLSEIMGIIGEREDCEFHVFTGKKTGKEICDEIEKQYSNFKIFYETHHKDLIQKISKYDYGAFFSVKGKTIPAMMTIDNLYFGSVEINSVTNRYFDYIDAGLPVIATFPNKLCDFLDEYGAIVKMDLSNLDIDYLKENKKKYKENVYQAKEKLLIDHQIQRLIDFFAEI